MAEIIQFEPAVKDMLIKYYTKVFIADVKRKKKQLKYNNKEALEELHVDLIILIEEYKSKYNIDISIKYWLN